jgi:hypothetical protein
VLRYISPALEPETVNVLAVVEVPVTTSPENHVAAAPVEPFDPFFTVIVEPSVKV